MVDLSTISEKDRSARDGKMSGRRSECSPTGWRGSSSSSRASREWDAERGIGPVGSFESVGVAKVMLAGEGNGVWGPGVSWETVSREPKTMPGDVGLKETLRPRWPGGR